MTIRTATIRTAVAADVPALSAVLARAFHDDPVTTWSFPREHSRLRWARRFFAWDLKRLVDQEVAWTTEATDGTALWALPGRWSESTSELLKLITTTWPGVFPHLARVLAGLSRIEARHPAEPHLYLAVLGVDPARQGEGIGSQLLAPGLELCDRESLPAYLESSKESNIAFYSRHGFRVMEELRLPGGPPVWPMWREPR
jgi:predicted N-acetyltransferase YhbS